MSREHLRLSCLIGSYGLGVTHNIALLNALAIACKFRHSHVEGVEDMRDVFVKISSTRFLAHCACLSATWRLWAMLEGVACLPGLEEIINYLF